MEKTIEPSKMPIYHSNSVDYAFHLAKNKKSKNLHNIFLEQQSSVFFEKLFLRIENYFFLGPAILAAIFIFFTNDNYCKVYLFDHYFVVSHFDAGLFWCSCLSPMFLLHYTLRKKEKRNAVLAWIHILLTLGIVFAFPFLYYQIPFLVEDLRMEFSPTQLYEIWHQKVNFANNYSKQLESSKLDSISGWSAYWNETAQAYASDGVTTITLSNNQVICQTRFNQSYLSHP